ncbi:enoyl-CoA hydratase [Candidatus Phycosocius spiralis]|uniref:Enoyl-CoA hydratase n=1 Tax=Candidatus Phycosocius spiralis TaxID=2815099 RepID=A0ABQ4PTF1_9PROT|nr:enoyl-CoA hydratase [Candidatus Phycosocius spiralis]GIU66296.1 enoyl-CoA hydratase [Candidatus Phycosocius spiralis]
MAYHTILLAVADQVATITLNRPEALNAFNQQLMAELAACLDEVEARDDVGAIVITGSAKAFAAGADIKEMANKSFADVYREDFITASWERVTRCRKPTIAAVAGFALGGGCELAMMCDLILAADTAKFGQPEIKLGVIPGAGGTQRFARAAGKAKAMDMILTGRMMDAAEAERCGIVARIVPADALLEEAHKTATLIAGYGTLAVMAAKEAIDRAFETPLAEGVRFERRLFHALFGTEDQKEGMIAFSEKRPAHFKGR